MLTSRARSCSFLSLVILFLTSYAISQSVTVSPSTLSFGNQVLNTASSVQKVTLKNGQTKSITITTITSSLTDYAQTNTCPVSPSTLAAGKSCTISVTFTPTVLGARNVAHTLQGTVPVGIKPILLTTQ